MFVGEFCCFLLLFGKRWYYRNEKVPGTDLTLSPGAAKATTLHLRTNINPLWLAIPATCDFMASTLMFIALTMVDASIYQMMRGIIVVIAALLSIIFLGRKLYCHHWVAIVLIVGGVAEVGIVAILKEGSSGSDDIVLGIMLLLLS